MFDPEKVATGDEGRVLADAAVAVLLEKRPHLKVSNAPKVDMKKLMDVIGVIK